LDHRRDALIEVSSSSYVLSLFSSKDGSALDEGAGATPSESSSASVGELWPGIDLLDEASLGGTSAGDQVSPSHADPRGSSGMGEGSSRVE
jgi:hypothetical protein